MDVWGSWVGCMRCFVVEGEGGAKFEFYGELCCKAGGRVVPAGLTDRHVS